MLRKRFFFICIFLIFTLSLLLSRGKKEKKSNQDTSLEITLVVPFSTGGATDLTARGLASGMKRTSGLQMKIENFPGTSGADGTKYVLDHKEDGNVMLVNGMLAFTSLPVNDLVETTFRDWDIWLATYSPNVIVVSKNSPYKTIEDLVSAMRERPGEIRASTGGVGSAGHFGAEVIKQVAGADYTLVPCSGGAEALIAMLSGEADFCPQLLAEFKDLLTAGDIRALCTLSDEDIDIGNGIVIPSILRFYPESYNLVPMGEVTGILVPKGLDEETLKAIDIAFDSAVKDRAFLEFCDIRSFSVIPMGREASQTYLEDFTSRANYILYDSGVAKVHPGYFGIER